MPVILKIHNPFSDKATMPSRRPANAKYAHIKDVLATVLENCRKESCADLARVKNIWNAELDPLITAHAQPTAIRSGILLVTVKSSTLTHQLRFLAKDIIHVINSEARQPLVSELKIITGHF